MSTRTQKRKNQQRSSKVVSEILSSPVLTEIVDPKEQGVKVAGPPEDKSARIENSILENLRASLKEEITSEIKSLLLESQREMVKILKPETNKNVKEQEGNVLENAPREVYSPTKSIRCKHCLNYVMFPCSTKHGTRT